MEGGCYVDAGWTPKAECSGCIERALCMHHFHNSQSLIGVLHGPFVSNPVNSSSHNNKFPRLINGPPFFFFSFLQKKYANNEVGQKT